MGNAFDRKGGAAEVDDQNLATEHDKVNADEEVIPVYALEDIEIVGGTAGHPSI